MPVLGELTDLSPGTVAAGGNEPEQMAISPDGTKLIQCNRGSSNLSLFEISPSTGKLTKLETIAYGEETYGVAFSEDGETVFICGQKSKKIAWYRWSAGKLKKEGEVAGGEGMHALTVCKGYLYAPAYEGKAIFQYKIEATGQPVALSPASVAITYQPHNIVFTNNGEFGFLSTGESAGGVGVVTRSNETGKLTTKEKVSNGGGPGFTEIVRIGPEQTTLYAIQEGTTNGGVVVFTLNPATGGLTKLEKIELGKAPKNIAIPADGANAYITEQSEAKISLFSRNTSTGALTAMSPAFIEPGESSTGPSFILVSANGKYVYAAMKESAVGKVAQLARYDPVAASLTTGDTITVSSTVSVASTAPRTASDTITESDQVVRGSLLLARALGDTVIVSDQAAAASIGSRLASDSASVSSGAVAQRSAGREAASTVSVASEAARGAQSPVRTAGDSIAETDQATSASAASRAITDGVSVTDSAVRSAQALARTGADSITIGSGAVGVVARARTAGDTVSESDSVSRGAQALSRTASDTAAVSDQASCVTVAFRSVSDTLTVTTAAVRGASALGRATSDSLSISSVVVRAFATSRTTADSVTFQCHVGAAVGRPPEILSFVLRLAPAITVVKRR